MNHVNAYTYFFSSFFLFYNEIENNSEFNILSLIKPTNIISIVHCQFCHSYSIRMKNTNILFKKEEEKTDDDDGDGNNKIYYAHE